MAPVRARAARCLRRSGKPWASYCNAEGRKRLIDAINYYYWQRDSQSKSYANNWGEAGARYIAKAWATSDDNRIERMTRETFGRGYFSLDELRPYIRTALAPFCAASG